MCWLRWPRGWIGLLLVVLVVRSDAREAAVWSGWIAASAELTDVAAVAALPDSAFRTEPLTPGEVAPRQVWMRLKLAPASAPVAEATSFATRLGILVIGTRYDDLVELFVPTLGGGWQALRSGESVGPHGRAWPGLSPAFPVARPADGPPLVLHARLSEHRDAAPVVTFHPDAAAFTVREQSEITENLLYFGLLGALFAYNLFLYARLRYRDLLYYLIYLACFAAAMFGGTYTATLFFPFPSPWRESILLAALNGAIVALLLFAREFHDLPSIAPRLARVTVIVAAVFSVGLLAPCFDYLTPWVNLAFTLNYTLLLAGLVFVLVVALHAWRRGARQARFFLLAFGLYVVGQCAVLLEVFGLYLPGEWGERVMRLGSSAEMLLLSFAISDRFRRIRAEKEALQATYTAQLERDVAARTRELQDTAARLAASNADKDQLVAIIAHDVRAPLVSLLAVARSLYAAAPTEAPALAHGIARRTDALLALINNLLDWARLHTGQFRHEPGPVNVAGIADAALRPLLPLAAEKGIRLDARVPDDLFARGDLHAVQCVLRNLLGNALKFTPAGGHIQLEAAREGDSIACSVRDTGPGLPPEFIALLATAGTVASTPDTSGERGAGIGLALCRDLLARDDGTLTFACPPSGGTVATVRLPAVDFPA